MGIYSDSKLLNWFMDEYPKHCKQKLDIGKSCFGFKNIDAIPHKLIGELMKKISVKDCIKIYETKIKNK